MDNSNKTKTSYAWVKCCWLIAGSLLVFNFFSLIYAATIGRTWFHDGGTYTFEIINQLRPSYDAAFTRYSDILLQLPALAILKISHSASAATLALYTNSLSYFLHPALSLVACFFILRNRKRLDLFIFPVLSFAIVTQTTLANAFGVVPGVLSLMWPLFFLALFPINKLSTWLAIFIFCTALAFEHEAGLFFTATLVLLKLIQWRQALLAKDKLQNLLLCGLFSCLTFWLLYKGIGPQAGESQYFKDALTAPLNDFRRFSIFILLLSIGALIPFFDKIQKSWLSLSLAGAIIASTYTIHALIENKTPWDLFWSACAARTYAVQLGCLLCFTTFIFIRDNKSFSNIKNIFFIGLTSCGLATSLVHDIIITSNWKRSMNFLESQIYASEMIGCKQITAQEFRKNMGVNGFNDVMVPYISMLLAIKNNTPIRNIIFTASRLPNFPQVTNFCCTLKERKLPLYERLVDIDSTWTLPVEPIIEAVKKKSDEYGCQ